MTKGELFSFYEKLYFHEIDRRYKLDRLLRLPLTISVAPITLIAFMINNLKIQDLNLLGAMFFALMMTSIISLIISIVYFKRSWYGSEYSFLPSAKDLEEYRNKLIETYKDFDNHDKLTEEALSDALYNYFVENSTKNTYVNDKRSLLIYKASELLIISFIFGVLTFLPFHFGNPNIKFVFNLKSPQAHSEGGETIVKEEQKPPPQRLIEKGIESTFPKPIKPTDIVKEK